MPMRVVFRLGVIEIGFGPNYVLYYNRTAKGGPYLLDEAATARWIKWLKFAVWRFNGRIML